MNFLGSEWFGYLIQLACLLMLIMIGIKRKILIDQIRTSSHVMKLRIALLGVVSIVLFTPLLSYLAFLNSKPFTPDNILNPIDKAYIAVAGTELHRTWVLDPQTWYINFLFKEHGITEDIYNPQMDLNLSIRQTHRMRYY